MSDKSILDVLARLPLIRLLNLKGYGRVLPATLEEQLASTGNVDDHLDAAELYQNKAQELEAEAVEFETAVATLIVSAEPRRIPRPPATSASAGHSHLKRQETQNGVIFLFRPDPISSNH